MSDPLASVVLSDGGAADDRAAMLDDLAVVMKSAAGRRFVWRIVKKSGLTHNAMTGNSYTYFQLGVQQLGNELVQLLFTERFLPDFRKMQDEHLFAEKARLNKTKEKQNG